MIVGKAPLVPAMLAIFGKLKIDFRIVKCVIRHFNDKKQCFFIFFTILIQKTAEIGYEINTELRPPAARLFSVVKICTIWVVQLCHLGCSRPLPCGAYSYSNPLSDASCRNE